MSESELAFPYKWWGRFFEAIGPQYGALLSEAMVRAGSRLTGADDDQLASFAAEGRRAAGSLDEDAARLTVRLHDERDQNAALVADLEREAQLILEHAPRGWSKRRRVARRQARVDAGARYERAESHRRLAAEAQERIRALGEQGRHLFDWFERNRDVLARGLASEQQLNRSDRAVYLVLGAPSIAALTAACLTADRAIELDRLAYLVEERGDRRQQLLLDVAIELRSGDGGQVLLDELLEHLHGEDLDRVLEGIAIRRGRAFRGRAAPTDLWIRAARAQSRARALSASDDDAAAVW
jgi:hypothetical protein